jgi:pimeloyl-ACP methyl ester carboxylesterase
VAFKKGRAVAGITHHRMSVNGAVLHYVTAGAAGSPILLVHGFPETWWTFSKLIPLLASRHRVIAVDLRGFGDSSNEEGSYDSTASAEDLAQFLHNLRVGPVHLTGQDISGATVFRLAVTHPELVRSFTAIEMGLPGFGLEALADITRGGAWHIGVLAAAGVPEMLLAGRERAFLGDFVFPALCAKQGAIDGEDLDEFLRTYSRPHAWRGSAGLYRSMLREGSDIQALARSPGLKVPVLAVGGGGGLFTANTLEAVTGQRVRSVLLEGVGHYVALEAPQALCDALQEFIAGVDQS